MKKKIKDIIHLGLPKYKEWINQVKKDYLSNSTLLSDTQFKDVSNLYPDEIVRNIQVIIARTFPYPPLKELGLPEIEYWNSMELTGITFGDLIFIKENRNYKSILFHECIHSSQSYFLGFDQQTVAYGLFTIYKNYDENPFEKTAYQFQDQFDSNTLDSDFINEVKKESFESYSIAMKLE